MNTSNGSEVSSTRKTANMTVESTDIYWNGVHYRWMRVPSFWVGSLVGSFSDPIYSN